MSSRSRPIEVPSLIPPAPVALSATDHPPLPKDVSQYWFVPATGGAGSASKDVYRDLARGAQAIADGQYAVGLALVNRRDLTETRLADYAKYYQAMALQGLSRFAEADAVLTPLVANTTGWGAERPGKTEARRSDDRATRSRARRAIPPHGHVDAKGASEDFWMLLGQAEEALDHRDHAIEAYRKVYYGFPLSGRVADAKTGLDRLHVTVGAGGSVVDEFARAERLFAGRRWAEARVALEPLATEVSTEDPRAHHAASRRVRLSPRPSQSRARSTESVSRRRAEGRGGAVLLPRRHARDGRSLDVHQPLARAREGIPDSQWAAETLDDLASFYIIDDQTTRPTSIPRAARQVSRGIATRNALPGRLVGSVPASEVRRDHKRFESAAVTFPRADYRPVGSYWSVARAIAWVDASGATARYRLGIVDYGNSY
jgi:hypothetical protein